MAKFFGLVLVVFFVMSCKKTEPYTSDLDYSYFPIIEGRFIEYKVTSIRHDEDLLPVIDSTIYYLKVVVEEKILNTTGDSVNKLIYYVKPSIDSIYTLDKVNTIYNNGYQGIYNLDNQKIVKLVFPATINKSWDANIYTTSAPLNSTIESKDYSGSIEGNSFGSLLKTRQLDFFSLVDYQKAYEVYAKDVGLVKVYYKNLVIQNIDTTDIRRGQEIYYDLMSYGVE